MQPASAVSAPATRHCTSPPACPLPPPRAVITYTKVVKQLEAGELPEWQDKAASPLARKYWRLGDDAKLLDVIKAIRADEMVHRDVNHVLAGVGVNDPNPFAPHYAREKDVSKHPAATGGQTNVPNK